MLPYVTDTNEKYGNYELVAIGHHDGDKGDGGHYYADCRNNIDDKWYRYDDSTVKQKPPELKSTTCYILVYQKTSRGKRPN